MAQFHHFTTIVPAGIPEQIETLATWHRAHGQPIHTLNHSREIAALRPELPDWVVPVERRFSQTYGRDYLPFTEILAAMEEQVEDPEDRVLLVNSDISLAEPEALGALGGPETDLFFASRMDVTSEGEIHSRYKYGYDVLSLRRSASKILDLPDFYMGLPWWDYILPLMAIINGYRVRRLDVTAFHHVLHAQRWSRVSFDHIGWNCMKLLLPDEMQAPPPTSERVQKFSEVANQFLNGDIAAGRTPVSPEKVRQSFLERVAAAPAIWPEGKRNPMARTTAVSPAPPAPKRAPAQSKQISPDPFVKACFVDLLHQLDALRTRPAQHIRAGHVDLGQGIWLSCDPAGQAELACLPDEDGPILQARAADSGKWACLGMRIDPDILTRGTYFGLFVEAQTQTPAQITPVLRYYPREAPIVDTPFPETLSLDAGSQEMFIVVAIDPFLAERAHTCEINLFFDTVHIDLKLSRLEPVLLW